MGIVAAISAPVIAAIFAGVAALIAGGWFAFQALEVAHARAIWRRRGELDRGDWQGALEIAAACGPPPMPHRRGTTNAGCSKANA